MAGLRFYFCLKQTLCECARKSGGKIVHFDVFWIGSEYETHQTDEQLWRAIVTFRNPTLLQILATSAAIDITVLILNLIHQQRLWKWRSQKFNPKMQLWASENRSPNERRRCKLVSKLGFWLNKIIIIQKIWLSTRIGFMFAVGMIWYFEVLPWSMRMEKLNGLTKTLWPVPMSRKQRPKLKRS